MQRIIIDLIFVNYQIILIIKNSTRRKEEDFPCQLKQAVPV